MIRELRELRELLELCELCELNELNELKTERQILTAISHYIDSFNKWVNGNLHLHPSFAIPNPSLHWLIYQSLLSGEISERKIGQCANEPICQLTATPHTINSKLNFNNSRALFYRCSPPKNRSWAIDNGNRAVYRLPSPFFVGLFLAKQKKSRQRLTGKDLSRILPLPLSLPLP